MRKDVQQQALIAAKRTVLASLLCCLALPASAQVVEIPTQTIDRDGNPVGQSSAGQVQGQAPQQPTADPDVGPDLPPAPPEQTVPRPQLNVDPNARIDDLIPPQRAPAAPAAPQDVGAGRQAGLGATAGAFSSAPTMIGDLFGGGLSTFGGSQTVRYSFHAPGFILSGAPGSSSSTLAFEVGTDIVPNDVFTTGMGTDQSGDGPMFADTFSILEPIPPSDAPTSPGPGFVFDGGTAVYTNNTTDTTPQDGQYNNGELWFIDYSYSQTLPGGIGGEIARPVPGPGVSVRRVKLSENFSPEVRDRCFASYNFFNDAFGGLGDVSRYTLGLERILVDQLISFEARLLMAGTYGSTQVLELAPNRDFELGNAALLTKGVLLRTRRFLWSGGLGITLPTADDTKIRQGGQNVLVVKNKTVHLLPFSAMLWRHSRKTSLQAYLQLDVAANGDEVFGDLTGGPLPKLGVFTDSTLMNIDVAMSHVIYRNRCRHALRQIIANGELHYTGTLQESDFVSNNGLTFTNLKRNFNVVNATAGCHFVLCNNLVVTPAMSVPLRDGLDKQFDYEAIVQVNYLR